MTINNDQQTLTATRDELSSIIDKALDRKIRALPDRSTLGALSRGGSQPPENAGIIQGTLQNGSPRATPTKEAIQKTFRFLTAIAENDHQTLRAVQQTYE